MISGSESQSFNDRNEKYIIDKYGNVVRERNPEQ